MSGNGQFQTSNGQILDPNGNVFTAHGVNVMFGGDQPTVDALKSDFPGINFVRLAVYNYDSPDSLASYVNQLTNAGIVVELENHQNNAGGAGGSQGTIFTGQQLQQETNWYSSVAAAFKSNPYVWFGTNNEPSETDSSGNNNPAALSQWQQTTYNAIRGAGNTNPVMVEINGWGDVNSMASGYTPSVYAGMTNIIGDLHFYGWLTNYSTDQSTVSNFLTAAVQHTQQVLPTASGTMPVLIGEFGNSTTGHDLDANANQVINAVTTSNVTAGYAAWMWGQGAPYDGLTTGGTNLSSYGQQIATAIKASAGTSASLPPPAVTPAQPASADNTIVTAAGGGTITDANGASWTIQNGAVMKNGAAAGYSANVTEIAYVKGVVYQENTDGNWWNWDGNAWTGSGTATSPLPQAADPITPSPDNTVVQAGSTDSITDAAGNAWTISNGVVNENGAAAGYSANVTEIAYAGGAIYQENNAGLWWQWNGTAWTGNGTSTSPVTGGATTPTTPSVPPTPPTPPTQDVAPGTWQVQSINGMQYLVLLPANFDASKTYSATLYLHQLDMGNGGPQMLENQINAYFNTSTFRSENQTILVAPLLDQNADPSGNTINWGGVSTADSQGETNALAALKQVMGQYKVDPTKVYVTGNSMGGIGTEDMLVKYNAYTGTEGKIFAAGLALAGADYGQTTSTMASVLQNVPYMAIHGGQDTQVPLTTDRTVYAAIHAAGGKMIYTEDASLGHDVWDTYYTQDGANSPLGWLYSQSASGTSTPVTPPTPPTPPATTASPDNTVVAAGSTSAITDANGHAWTIANGAVMEDGKAAGYSANVTEIAYVAGNVYQENSSNLWWEWNGSTWAGNGSSTSPVHSTPTPPPVPPVTPDSIALTFGGVTQVATPGSSEGGDTFSLLSGGVIQASLGSTPQMVQFTGSSGAQVTGGSGVAIVSATAGANSFTAGSGPMMVTGGTGADAYTYHAGAGFLGITDFSAAKGDTLNVDSSLKAGMQSMNDGAGGTMLAFGGGSVIDLHGVTTAPVIHWS